MSEVVYIVDDDHDARKSLCWLLESSHYQTRSFESAEDFIANHDDSLTSCLLLDIRMRGASGLRLQEMLHSQGQEIPIIFVSGHVDVPVASVAFRSGACDVLTKPVDESVLLERVEEALGLDRQRRQAKSHWDSKQRLVETLTPKEHEVFWQLLAGKTIKQLAAHFEVSFQTVAKHRSRVLNKLGCETDVQLINRFRERDSKTSPVDPK